MSRGTSKPAASRPRFDEDFMIMLILGPATSQLDRTGRRLCSTCGPPSLPRLRHFTQLVLRVGRCQDLDGHDLEDGGRPVARGRAAEGRRAKRGAPERRVSHGRSRGRARHTARPRGGGPPVRSDRLARDPAESGRVCASRRARGLVATRRALLVHLVTGAGSASTAWRRRSVAGSRRPGIRKKLEREKAALATDKRRLERRLPGGDDHHLPKKSCELLGIPLKPFEADEIE